MGTVSELCASSFQAFLCSTVLLAEPAVPDDLTPEEKQELENIRRRKQELLEDIQTDQISFLKETTMSPERPSHTLNVMLPFKGKKIPPTDPSSDPDMLPLGTGAVYSMLDGSSGLMIWARCSAEGSSTFSSPCDELICFCPFYVFQRLKDEIAKVTNEIDSLGSTQERVNMQRSKQMAMGRKKFNMDPKKGIQFLIENELLKNTCEDIAQFLYKGEGLNKTAIGDYLGERDDFNIQVLHAFVELHEFTDLNLVQALRQFLWSFRLPGEAQKIDRMMEAFAQRYCQCNPGVFQSTDTCYVLSFAIIMLNTSLHNPNVKDKPSAERFICMNRGINDGGDLPEDLLRNLYESIKNEPFKIPEDDGNDLTHTFFNPDREGWLLKLGGRVKTWKRRWFILTDNCLYYFEYTTDKEPRGIIPLENLSIREVEESKKPNCFELFIPDNKDQVIKACKTEADGRVVEGNHTFYRISAPTTEEKEEWMNSIKAAISRDPFYEMLAARKKKASSLKRQ
ncbi:SEC7 and coiled-coil domain-containing protein 1 [Triplophysa tibetana]|uniref:SEC7 and coiled-coil domain-containing protein 1 n=1 Tax=Triplophysa tibetana TaxID=1572043 RepID=A0A5A9PRW7_9TELE|nr:SEC7 and coiled-coil domain-containing protein 1 [Triplophysa tibetana]